MAVRAVLIGAGRRGVDVFGRFALDFPEKLQYLAVVEKNKSRRDFFAKQHNIPVSNCFSTVNEFTKSEIANNLSVAINSTSDSAHFTTTKILLRYRFNVLLEKPIATNWEECQTLSKLAKEQKVSLVICHVLRHTPFFTKIKDLVDKGSIGKIKQIHLVENVGDLHFAHSYVRGNWRNSKTSGPISLTKTSHDFDIIVWLLNYASCLTISSYSPERFFRKQNAPTKVPSRCFQGCSIEKNCRYNAINYYLNPNTKESRKRAVDVTMDKEKILKKLQNGPYGKCVYRCDNNVPDTQITTMTFSTGAVATLTMVADQKPTNRTLKILGKHGKLNASLIDGMIEIYKKDGSQLKFDISTKGDTHGGGDYRLISAFIDGLYNKDQAFETEISKSLISHKLAFLAEKSRLEHL